LGTCEQKSVLVSVGGGESGYRLYYLPCDGVLARRRSGNLIIIERYKVDPCPDKVIQRAQIAL
jgi:hypothetical protein